MTLPEAVLAPEAHYAMVGAAIVARETVLLEGIVGVHQSPESPTTRQQYVILNFGIVFTDIKIISDGRL
jgi:hypothetical protein